jgi:hypothetical protein
MTLASPLARAAFKAVCALSASAAVLAFASAERAAEPRLTLTPRRPRRAGAGDLRPDRPDPDLRRQGRCRGPRRGRPAFRHAAEGPGPEASPWSRARRPPARPPSSWRAGQDLQRQGRGLRPRRRPDRRHHHRRQARGPVLRRGQRLAAGRAGRRQGPRPAARRQHRRRPALRLARLHAGQRPPLPERRHDQVDPRRHGRPQAERPALAPGRRPGLAAGDQEVSEADLRGRLARAGRGGGRIPRPASRSATKASTPRTRCAIWSPTPPRAGSPSFPRSRCRATPWRRWWPIPSSA